ncbi:hypothetical protein EDC39_102114 [Geothermobacter ehrlichii]|uniref:Uncharacterized protein n=1 Tax=Geothermobacter ehrlichii TaxID=213224 RepID=A0A5D3WPI0_9BACT|nr:hypothetical protein [Geothermobacter ehrlichii]TYO99591.1 hypothetical protein EDC39_102114 [Geothermobacter ehrlichii]
MDEIRVCQICGYQRGFHVAVRKVDGGQKVVLICPDCGQSVDPGWMVTRLHMPPQHGRRYE